MIVGAAVGVAAAAEVLLPYDFCPGCCCCCCQDGGELVVAIVATTAIPAGTELTYDYRCGHSTPM